MITIEYRDDNDTLVARMNQVPGGRLNGITMAQRYMIQFPSIASGHVLCDETETVVSRATEWQKRN